MATRKVKFSGEVKTVESLTEQDIKDFCKEKISHYKIPHYIHFTDSFPLTVTGKVQKFIMRDMSVQLFGLQS